MRSLKVSLTLAGAMLLLVSSALLIAPERANALTPYVVARFKPEAGRITDAAIHNGAVALVYPDEGRIAEYALSGKLNRHIVREGGVERRFRPSYCIAGSGSSLLVFDEAEHKLFTIADDGNWNSGVDLAYPLKGGGAVALSRISGIAGSADLLSVMLGDKDVLARFDGKGVFKGELDLKALLPYSNAVPARPQLLPDGSLFMLEYHQGALLYRRGSEESLRRVRIESPDGVDAAPVLQDFAVDSGGNMLVITAGDPARVLLLSPGTDGYRSQTIKLDLPAGAKRIACRYSRGKYILWLRDEPFVLVLELR